MVALWHIVKGNLEGKSHGTKTTQKKITGKDTFDTRASWRIYIVKHILTWGIHYDFFLLFFSYTNLCLFSCDMFFQPPLNDVRQSVLIHTICFEGSNNSSIIFYFIYLSRVNDVNNVLFCTGRHSYSNRITVLVHDEKEAISLYVSIIIKIYINKH